MNVNKKSLLRLTDGSTVVVSGNFLEDWVHSGEEKLFKGYMGTNGNLVAVNMSQVTYVEIIDDKADGTDDGED